MILYAISGLGADERVFQFLQLNPDYALIHIKWIKPIQEESLSDYAKKLSSQIDRSVKFGLIGVSFGGLIAVELSLFLNPEITILISSAATKNEIPFYYRLIGKTGVLSLLPTSIFKLPNFIASFLFGAQHKELLVNILKDTDLKFAKWAIKQLCNWSNVLELSNLIKIHGTKDKLIPLKRKSNTFVIEKGGHFMIVDKAEKISLIINEEIDKRDT